MKGNTFRSRLTSQRALAPFNTIYRTTFNQRFPGIRYASLEAGEGDTGHISANKNQGVLFINNLYPLNLQWLFRLPIGGEMLSPKLAANNGFFGAADPEKLIKKAQPSAQVVEVLPRFKEGGAFVKFTDDSGTPITTIGETVEKYLVQNQTKPIWSPLQGVQANLVRGKPWVEDLYRLPSQRLRVEFLPTSPGGEVAELSQEQLYSFFRPYGKLADIITQPSDSKVLPKYAQLDFASIRKATTAKNCLHGYTVTESEGGGKLGTVFRISYEKKQKGRFFWDWLTGHPRIVIPALAALVAGITVAVFDPIRTFFIKIHITRSLHLEDNKYLRWAKDKTNDFLASVRLRKEPKDAGMEAIWEDRRGHINQLQTWFMETADTFIIVQGPRGSGKRELVVDQALKNHKNKLIIDCKPIQEARGDSSTINATAAEVGYYPVFSWMNSISGLVDLAAQGATGVKTGFSETLENQITKIFNNTATALKQVALEGRKRDDRDANLTDDEYLEAHPERRPVVVIDNFLHKTQEGTVVYDKIAEWAARITTSNLAHVVFLTNDVAFSKSLSKALPDRAFRQIGLSDTSIEVAKRFVVNHLDFDAADAQDGIKELSNSQRRKDLADLDEVLPALGGRLTDLEFLARRVKAGETPRKAVEEIVDQSASEILKMFIFGIEDGARQWTPQQAWLLIKQLANAESLRYNEILLSDAYKTGGDRALQALEQAELITIQSASGRPYAIKPGRPVYSSAFQALTKDNVLRSRFDLAVLTESIKIENTSVEKYEQELHLLGELPTQPSQITGRVQYLLGKLQTSQAKIEKYERESAALKKVLMSEF
ncbi:RNA12 protein-domain-containing protein [Delphinella strobiligena]|nr:RNA12 protein-domain-containing protein [Delphinella strobiligena]